MDKVKIGNYIKQIRGVSYKSTDLHGDLNSDSVILLRANNINEGKINFDDIVYVDKSKVKKEQYLKKGDILVCASSGSKELVGKAAFINKDYAVTFGAFCKLIRPKDCIAGYLGHYFNSQMYKEKISSLALGANINNIRNEHIDELLIYLPNKAEQQNISILLDEVSDLTDKRKKQLEKLDELVKSRFVEMFGNVIRNDKGWEQYTFSDIATSRLGKMLDAKQQTGKYAYPYLANFNVQWFRFEIENLNKMDFNEADRQEFELRDGDLLVCEGGEIGRCAVWHNEIQPCYFQKALHRVRCNQHIVLPDYMAWWFKYNCDHKGFAAIEGAKATIAHLPGAKLKVLKVTVPPIELQNQFVAFLKQTDKSKLEVQKSLEKLEVLKKALMQKYFG